MSKIWNIAKNELQRLFYSPVAWILLCVFMAQAATFFIEPFYWSIRMHLMDFGGANVTHQLIGQGLLGIIPYLYIYIPLLTMGLITKEKNESTIKLLYASPVSSTHIVLGKFVAMVALGCVFGLTLLCFILFGGICVEHFDYPQAFCGLVGFLLIFFTFAAIGLFISSLFSNQVAVCVTTFAVLALLNYSGKIGQSLPFVRDITYWLCLTNRTKNSMDGLVSSVDVIYFLTLMVLMLYLTIVKINSEKEITSRLHLFVKYALPVVVAILIGFVTTRPSLEKYWDTTAVKMNTLTETSQKIIGQLDGGLTLTTFVNLMDPQFSQRYAMPSMTMDDMNRMVQYARFKPEMKQQYVYYYADIPERPGDETSLKERAQQTAESMKENFDLFVPVTGLKENAQLRANGYKLCRRIEREGENNSKSSWLYFYDDIQQVPSETEISAAMLKLEGNQPITGFLTGHGERHWEGSDDDSWEATISKKNNRMSMTNQGLSVESVSAERQLPEELQTLVVADLQKPLSNNETRNILTFLRKGGNMMIALEGKESKIKNYTSVLSELGVTAADGVLVRESTDERPDLVVNILAPEALKTLPAMGSLLSGSVTMQGATSLSFTPKNGFTVTPICKAPGTYGLKRGVVNLMDKSSIMQGTQKSSDGWCTMLALTRKFDNGRTQRIVVSGDADWLSNREMNTIHSNIRTINSPMSQILFTWMSNDYVPLKMNRPDFEDKYVDFPYEHFKTLRMLLYFILPLVVLLGGLTICAIRKRK